MGPRPDLSTGCPDRPSHDYALANFGVDSIVGITDRATGNRVRCKLTREHIRIGCAIISVEAAKFILQKHVEAFAEIKELDI